MSLLSLKFMGYHHYIMIALTISIILLSLSVAGSSSYSTMTNIYIISLSYRNSTVPPPPSQVNKPIRALMENLKGASQLEVRAGYFGMCVRQKGVVWICNSDMQGILDSIGEENDPLNLVRMGGVFRDEVLFSGLHFMCIALAVLAFFLLCTFPGWHEENREGSVVDVRPFPSRPVSQVALLSSFVAAALCLIASVWQHIGAVGAAALAESAGYGNIKVAIGSTAMVCTWIATGLLLACVVGLLVLILSIIVLDRLTDDD